METVLCVKWQLPDLSSYIEDVETTRQHVPSPPQGHLGILEPENKFQLCVCFYLFVFFALKPSSLEKTLEKTLL